MSKIKVVPAIKRYLIDIDAIRIYLPEIKKEVDCTRESGEKPRILVKLTNRGAGEVEIVFLGNFHVEDLCYYRKDPKTWVSRGFIVLNLDQLHQLVDSLLDLEMSI